MSAPTDDATTTEWPNTNDLLEEYEHWLTLPNMAGDEFSAFGKLAALYRFALTHQDSPGNALLFEAIAVVEDAWNK